MRRRFDGSAVPRQSVFVLADGTFVVQWDDTRVQELLSGRYRDFDDEHFGHAITNYELNQLKAAQRVEHYNRQYIWLYALPEARRYAQARRTLERTRNRVRSYYLNTTLPQSQSGNIKDLLFRLNVADNYAVRIRDDLVAILGIDASPFPTLHDAEAAQAELVKIAPEVFGNLAVAFIETTQKNNHFGPRIATASMANAMDLSQVIASQTDTFVTRGKRVVLINSHQDERQAIDDLLRHMELEVRVARNAADTLTLLEDFSPHLLVMDLQLPDMHGWQMLGKIREIQSPRNLLTAVIADNDAAADHQTFALTVAKVDFYLVRPISLASLRQYIWSAFRKRQAG